MAETAPTTPRSAAQVGQAWSVLEAQYLRDPLDPVIAGARAAAEWTLGVSPVSPITNERVAATATRAGDEMHRSAMVEMGILPGDGQYARGASGWLFWWVGLRSLPPWLRAVA